jgi:hypothetical protein
MILYSSFPHYPVMQVHAAVTVNFTIFMNGRIVVGNFSNLST